MPNTPNKPTIVLNGSLPDCPRFEIVELMTEMLFKLGFQGTFGLKIVTKSKGDGQRQGTVHLKRGFASGIQVIAQPGDNDTCYQCDMVHVGGDQTRLMLDLSAKLGEKRTFFGGKAVKSAPCAPSTEGSPTATAQHSDLQVLTGEELIAIKILKALGDPWFTFGNVWKTVLVPQGILDKKMAHSLIEYLLEKKYLDKTGQRRATRYQLTEQGKLARKTVDTTTPFPPRPVLPSEDSELTQAQIAGLHIRSDEYAEAHVQDKSLKERLASLGERRRTVECALRGIEFEIASNEKDRRRYQEIMADPSYKADHDRYMALIKK